MKAITTADPIEAPRIVAHHGGMHSLFSSHSEHSDEKEQLSWLPSLTFPAPPVRPTSALPATRHVHVVNVAGDGLPSHSTRDTEVRSGEESDTAVSRAATAWRCLTDRRPRTAGNAAGSVESISHGSGTAVISPASRAPFNSSAARFLTTSTARHARAASPERRAVSASSSSPSSSPCPSHSIKGYGAGFVSSDGRFPRSRRTKPSPGSYRTAQQLECAHINRRHHASLASAAFHSANHDGQHLPPQPSQPRVATPPATATATAAHSPPSVPFVSPYFLRRSSPAPTAYQQSEQSSAQTVRAASIGSAARPAPFGEQRGMQGEPTPSSASYSPLWQVTRPSSSNAASVHFTSLTQRMQQQHTASAVQQAHDTQSGDGDRATEQPRPHSAHLIRSTRQHSPSSSLHPPLSSRATALGGRLSYGIADSPSPAAYNVRLDSSRPYAPHYSFAPPVTPSPASGVSALLVTRGGPGLTNNLTRAGRAAEKERWALHCHPETDTATSEQPTPTRSWSASAGLSVSESTSLTGDHSFHFNHRHVWL